MSLCEQGGLNKALFIRFKRSICDLFCRRNDLVQNNIKVILVQNQKKSGKDKTQHIDCNTCSEAFIRDLFEVTFFFFVFFFLRLFYFCLSFFE